MAVQISPDGLLFLSKVLYNAIGLIQPVRLGRIAVCREKRNCLSGFREDEFKELCFVKQFRQRAGQTQVILQKIIGEKGETRQINGFALFQWQCAERQLERELW